METTPNRESGDPQAKPCPICSDSNYEWGTPGSSNGLYYVPPGGIFGFGGGEGLWARKCLSCGNVQLFSKATYDNPFNTG